MDRLKNGTVFKNDSLYNFVCTEIVTNNCNTLEILP